MNRSRLPPWWPRTGAPLSPFAGRAAQADWSDRAGTMQRAAAAGAGAGAGAAAAPAAAPAAVVAGSFTIFFWNKQHKLDTNLLQRALAAFDIVCLCEANRGTLDAAAKYVAEGQYVFDVGVSGTKDPKPTDLGTAILSTKKVIAVGKPVRVPKERRLMTRAFLYLTDSVFIGIHALHLNSGASSKNDDALIDLAGYATSPKNPLNLFIGDFNLPDAKQTAVEGVVRPSYPTHGKSGLDYMLGVGSAACPWQAVPYTLEAIRTALKLPAHINMNSFSDHLPIAYTVNWALG